jgi:release factor glutamine methyltransferase
MQLIEYRKHFYKELQEVYPITEIQSFLKRLIQSYFEWDPTFIAIHPDYALNQSETAQLDFALLELKKYNPIQYILNEAFFMGHSFYVDESVLIPRPETEELVSWMLSDFSLSKDKLKVLDIGTGSGCIPIALAKENPNLNITAIDVSPLAIEVAKKNAKRHKVDVHFSQRDIIILSNWEQSLDVIVSNPPYIKPEEKNKMLSNVLDYEPHLALFTSEDDSLFFYKKITAFAEINLKTKGVLYFEINPKCVKALKKMISYYSFKNIVVENDIFGKNRMLKAIKK